MSNVSIDYIISLLSASNDKVSKLETELSELKTNDCIPASDELSELNKLQIENASLKKSVAKLQLEKTDLEEEISELKKLQIENASLKKSIAKLRLEKNELLSIMTTTSKKYKVELLSHQDYIDEVKNIIEKEEFDKLFSYVKFDLALMMDRIENILKKSGDDLIMHIIDNSVDLEVIDSNGWKLIHYFSNNKKISFEVFKHLVDKNIDLKHKTNYGNTPSHLTLGYLNYKFIKYLLDKNIEFDVKNIYNETPIDRLKFNTNITEEERALIKNLIKT